MSLPGDRGQLWLTRKPLALSPSQLWVHLVLPREQGPLTQLLPCGAGPEADPCVQSSVAFDVFLGQAGDCSGKVTAPQMSAAHTG